MFLVYSGIRMLRVSRQTYGYECLLPVCDICLNAYSGKLFMSHRHTYASYLNVISVWGLDVYRSFAHVCKILFFYHGLLLMHLQFVS